VCLRIGDAQFPERGDTLSGKISEADLQPRQTHLAHSREGAFLGALLLTNITRIQKKKVAALKAKVKVITRRNQERNLA